MPEWWKTPALANSSTSQVQNQPSFIAAARIMPLLTNPENSGKAEIEAAPTMHRTVVSGIDL
jgi:hypothetical protein